MASQPEHKAQTSFFLVRRFIYEALYLLWPFECSTNEKKDWHREKLNYYGDKVIRINRNHPLSGRRRSDNRYSEEHKVLNSGSRQRADPVNGRSADFPPFFVGEAIHRLVDGKVPLTAERMKFLGQLLSERNQNVPLQLSGNADKGTQEFAIVADKTDDSTKLRYDHSYKIRVASDDESNARWLGVNPTLQGYVNVALLWAGKYEDATTVQFHSVSLNKEGQYIEPNEVFAVVLYDRQKQRLGYANSRWLKDISTEKNKTPPDNVPRVGTDISFKRDFGVGFCITYL